jgi:hypothetical protein
LFVAVTKEGDCLRLPGIGHPKLVAAQIDNRLPMDIERYHVQVHHLRLLLRGIVTAVDKRQTKDQPEGKPK